MQTAWGNHSLIAATRNLISEALKVPYNQRFQIVCETSIPIRNSIFVYEQLLAINASRVAALTQVIDAVFVPTQCSLRGGLHP